MFHLDTRVHFDEVMISFMVYQEFYSTCTSVVHRLGDLQSVVECIVATEHDAEGRRLTLLNGSTEDRFIEVTSYAEPVLTTDDTDSAHPLFAKMFLRTEIDPKGDVIRVMNLSSRATLMARINADGSATVAQR